MFVLFTVPGVMSRQYFNILTHKADNQISLGEIVACATLAVLGRIVFTLSGDLLVTIFRFRTGAHIREALMALVVESTGLAILPVGDIVTRFRDDVDEICRFVTAFCELSGQTTYALIAFAIMASIDIRITIVVAAVVTIAVAISKIGAARLRQYRAASRKSAAKVTELLGEIFGSIQAVQIAGAEDHICYHLTSLSNERRKRTVRESWYNSVLSSSSDYASVLGASVIVLLSASYLRDGSLSVGDFALFSYFVGYVSALPNSIGNIIISYNLAGVSIDRINSMLHGETMSRVLGATASTSDHLSEPGSSMPLESLSISGLSYRYPNSTNGIEQISLTVNRGTITAIVGAIGAGKTTLIRCLLGLLPKDSGEIRWNGKSVSSLSDPTIPRAAYAPQMGQLFSTTIKNNVLFGMPDELLEALEIAHRAILTSDLSEMPDRWETTIGSKGVRLSGGQKQRVIAARLLVQEASLMFIDDLTSALDADTERLLWERIFSASDRTFIVASNRMAVLDKADAIVVMRNGTVAAQGTKSELQALFRSDNWLELAIGEGEMYARID